MDKLAVKFFLLLTCLVSPFAGASEKDWYFKPYIGSDVGTQRVQWEASYGDFHFRHHHPFVNLNFGILMHKYLAFEFGYESMFERERRQYYSSDTPVLGFVGFVGGGAANNQSYLSDAHMNGFNASLLLRYPIFKKTDLLFFAGAVWSRLHLSTTLIRNGMSANRTVYWHSDRHAVGRFGVGIRQMISTNFGARLVYLWENTSRLQATTFPGSDITPIATPIIPEHFFTVRPERSHIYSIGLFYQGDWA